MSKGIIYYTDNRLGEPIFSKCQEHIAASGLPIVSCSLKPISFGKNIVLENRFRSYPTMVEQIITALENLDTDYVFFCEHDVLYHPSHFEFTPERNDVYYYNINNWRWDYPQDRAIQYDGLTSLSMLCCNRSLVLAHYRARLKRIEELGWDKIRSREPRWARRMGYEPGTKKIRRGGFSDEESLRWRSSYPNIDIRHGRTFSQPKTTLDSFIHQPTGWKEVTLDKLPGWDARSMNLKPAAPVVTITEPKTLSVVIPARNEMFLRRTVEDLLQHIEGNTDIIVVLDGEWADPALEQHPKVNVIYVPEARGHRAAVNLGVRLSRSRYIMKVDAHCAFDQGFDVKMMDAMQDDWTMVPVMRNLHVFDWVCPQGHRRYQGPSGPCTECGRPTVRDIVWIPKTNPESTAFRFDRTLKFQYFSSYKKRQIGDIVDTMSLQGSCFMVTRKKFLELDLCEEAFGAWGQQGTEVACKTWLSGGRVVCNRKTWYAHLFRTQGRDFGFPYELSGHEVERAREYSRKLFLEGRWPKAKYQLQWLVDRFAPVPDWEEIKV